MDLEGTSEPIQGGFAAARRTLAPIDKPLGNHEVLAITRAFVLSLMRAFQRKILATLS
jgi:hypothetical protein